MTPSERIDYLIKTLEGDNASAFARRIGARKDTMSRARNGLIRPAVLYKKILEGYPQVRRAWLVDGRGEPMYEDQEKGEVLMKVEALEKEVRALRRAIEKLSRGVIENAKDA